jgi:hypothetical protein
MYMKELSIDYFVYFIIFIKIIFVISAIGHVILSHSTNSNANKIDPKLVYWKKRTEFIFIISMALLLIYHFNPRSRKEVNSETSLLFFLFGCVLIITADWNIFFKESPWYQKIVSSLS